MISVCALDAPHISRCLVKLLMKPRSLNSCGV